MMRKIVFVIGLVILVSTFSANVLFAQEECEENPLITLTDPSITGESGIINLFTADSVPKGLFSLAFWYNNWDREASDLDVNDWNLSLAYGLTDRLEIAFNAVAYRQTDYDYIHMADAPFIQRYPAFPFVSPTIEEGFGDIRIGAKYVLMPETASAPGFALAGHLKIATGDEEKGLSSGGFDFGGDLVLSKRVSKPLLLTGNLGMVYRNTPGDLDDLGISLGSEARYGAGARIYLNDRFRIISELAGGSFFGDDNLPDLNSYFDFRVGVETRFVNGLRMALGYSSALVFDEPADNGDGAFFALSFSRDRTYTISGIITHCNGEPMSNVYVTFTDPDVTICTDETGAYSLEVRTGWSGTATPKMAGYFFLPEPRSYEMVREDYEQQNYIGWPEEVTVGGTILEDGKPVPADSVTITHSNGATAKLDADGNYSFTVRGRTSGTITPTSECFDLTPESASYEDICEPVMLSFTAKRKMFTISGTIVNHEGQAIAGQVVSFGDREVVTDERGRYALEVPCGWGGAAVPAAGEYFFISSHRTYDNVTGDMDGQDYVGYAAVVFFEFDSFHKFRIGTEDVIEKTLTAVANYLEFDKRAVIGLHGHTCYIQLRCENMALSKARVLYILKKLEGKGVDRARMTWAYHGETMPAYSNTEEITRRNNRRVDIKLNEVIDNQEEITETIEYELWKEECK